MIDWGSLVIHEEKHRMNFRNPFGNNNVVTHCSPSNNRHLHSGCNEQFDQKFLGRCSPLVLCIRLSKMVFPFEIQ